MGRPVIWCSNFEGIALKRREGPRFSPVRSPFSLVPRLKPAILSGLQPARKPPR